MRPLNFDAPRGKTIRDLTDEEFDRLAELDRDYQDMRSEMPPTDDELADMEGFDD